MPELRARRFPATVYVTTRDAVEAQPVFNVAIRYLLWKSKLRQLDLSRTRLGPSDTFALDSSGERERAIVTLSALADEADGPGRTGILRSVALALQLDWDAFKARRLIQLMNQEELADIARQGFDLQLHTHDHLFGGLDRDFVEGTVLRNREALTRIAGRTATHFCYPSGEYAQEQLPWLAALGVESATTCKPGFIDRTTPRLELGRFLDGENITDVEFEAEVSGFLQAMRTVRAAVRMN